MEMEAAHEASMVKKKDEDEAGKEKAEAIRRAAMGKFVLSFVPCSHHVTKHVASQVI
jgi:hypothetical protein